MDAADTLVTTAQASPGISGTLMGVILLMLFSLIPAIIAFSRRHANAVPIALTGILFGWTLIGWGVALIWSFTTPTAAVAAVQVAGGAPVYQAPAAKPKTGSKAVKFIGMTAAVLVVIVAVAMIFSKKPTQDQAGQQQQQQPVAAVPPAKQGVPVPAEELFGQ